MTKALCPICRSVRVVLETPPSDATSVCVPTCLGCRAERGILSTTVRVSRFGDLDPVAVPVVFRDGFISVGA